MRPHASVESNRLLLILVDYVAMFASGKMIKLFFDSRKLCARWTRQRKGKYTQHIHGMSGQN